MKRKKLLLTITLLAFAVAILITLLVFRIKFQQKTGSLIKITFKSKYEVAGKKYGLNELGLNINDSLDKYNFLVLELRPSSAQRFQIGFNTNWGYNELRIMPYAVGAWSRLVVPLRLYREKPRPSADLASYNNIPGNMGWFNLGEAKRGPLNDVDSIGFRMYAPIGNPTLEIKSIRFSVDDPGDKYLESTPLIDEFGQWNLGDYDGKAHSEEELRKIWIEEEQSIKPGSFNYSKFGGYANTQVEATGFFRTEKLNNKWWFVDPEGHLFLSLAVDCIRFGGGTTVKMDEQRKGVYKKLPPKEIEPLNNNISYGNWNLYRRFGKDWIDKSKEMTIMRMDAWGINTIANWSDPSIINMNRKPFMLQLRGLDINNGIMGLANVYSPDFVSNIENSVKNQVLPYITNPWLIGWFTGNEPAWIGEEVRLIDLIKENGDEYFKKALIDFIASGDTPERRKEFVYKSLRIFLETVDNALKKYDPNHLHVGLRLGYSELPPADEILAICKDVYDVYSFNSYSLVPNKNYMDYILEKTGLPMIIGEFHFGTTDRGMAQSLWQVDNQMERGVAYRYYVENGFKHPGLIGVAYFQWSDQSTTGRSGDGENYNCGLVDVTDQPYKYQVNAMTKTAELLYNIHTGELEPINKAPKRARGHGLIPDFWNK